MPINRCFDLATRKMSRREPWASRRARYALGVVLLTGCADAPMPDRGEIVNLPFEEAFRTYRTIVLEETPAALLVNPELSFDPRGGFLVADLREAQVRRYGPDGRLVWSTGSKGEGPGEFDRPGRAIRLGTQAVLVLDHDTRFTVLDSTGRTVLLTGRMPFRRVDDAIAYDDSLVLVAGALGAGPGENSVHLWNPSRNAVLRSFFSPPIRPEHRELAVVAGWAKFSLREDTIAAVFSLTDSVYLFDPSGRRLPAIALGSPKFRRVRGPPPEPGPGGVQRLVGWMGGFHYMAAVYWMPNGDLLVAYQGMQPERALARTWHLVRIQRALDRRTEVNDVPRLLGVHGDTLYFVDPRAEAPNRWLVAGFRRP